MTTRQITETSPAIFAGAARTLTPLVAQRRLIQIEAEVRKLDTRIKRAAAAFSAAEAAMRTWRKRNPKPTPLSLDDAALAPMIEKHGMTIVGGVLRAVEHMGANGYDRTKIQAVCKNTDAGLAEIIVKRGLATNEWVGRRVKAECKRRFGELETALDHLANKVEDLCDEAAEISAATVDALKCKARIVKSHDSPNPSQSALSTSIVRDLVALRA